MIERERALAATPLPEQAETKENEKSRHRGFWTFAFGFITGGVVLFAFALFAAIRNP
jgi:hypothetical protein